MSIVVIGNFDGVHKGHQQILNRAKEIAADEKIVALTFDPHPVSIFAPERTPTLLTILSDKIELLKIHNADQVAVIKFTKEFAAMAPEEFVNKVLVEQLKATTVIVGQNFTYGFKAAGNVQSLAQHPAFETIVLDLQSDAEVAISSTRIRSAIVNGDRDQVTMAIHNLIENAINYSPDATRVAIAVTEADGICEISVSDQGIGIPEKDLERIFERFYRVDAARSRITGGTGLGLSIVKHVVTNHGGDISVWSVEGAGSTFTIRLPLANDLNNLSNPAVEATK